jgi:hypothetical protein
MDTICFKAGISRLHDIQPQRYKPSISLNYRKLTDLQTSPESEEQHVPAAQDVEQTPGPEEQYVPTIQYVEQTPAPHVEIGVGTLALLAAAAISRLLQATSIRQREAEALATAQDTETTTAEASNVALLPDPQPSALTLQTHQPHHRRKSLTSEACYVCYEDFDTLAVTNDPGSVMWCRTCGTNVHTLCNEQWLVGREESGRTCGFCRQIWEAGEEES